MIAAHDKLFGDQIMPPIEERKVDRHPGVAIPSLILRHPPRSFQANVQRGNVGDIVANDDIDHTAILTLRAVWNTRSSPQSAWADQSTPAMRLCSRRNRVFMMTLPRVALPCS